MRKVGPNTMRRLLTTGIKAILAIAALSTAAHWTLRMQREPTAQVAALSTIPDPATTGSIVPRKIERVAQAPVADAAGRGLDQDHLLKLISGATTEKPKPQKAVARR